MKFWPFNPYYKRSDWNTSLAKRFSEILMSKLRNKNTYCQSLLKWSEIELYSPSWYSLIRNLWQIHSRHSHVEFTGKIKLTIPPQQNYVAWLVKNSKTVFSKVMQKISLSVSGKQASNHSAWSLPFSEF